MITCQYCGKELKNQSRLRPHLYNCPALTISCEHCLKKFISEIGLKIHTPVCHEFLKFLEARASEPPEVKIRLTPEDAFSKNPDKAAIVGGKSEKKSRLKNETRFYKKLERGKSARNRNRALKHGWKPKEDFRHSDKHHL